MLLGYLISALILLVIIKMFTGEDVGFGSAFIAALIAGIVGGLLARLALLGIGGVPGIAVASIIQFVVTAVAVQLVCSTDVKRVLMIAGTYMVVCIGLTILMVALLAG